MVLHASTGRPDASPPSSSLRTVLSEQALPPSPSPPTAQALAAVESALRRPDDAHPHLAARVDQLHADVGSVASPQAGLTIVRINEAVEALAPNEAEALLGQETLARCHDSLVQVTHQVLLAPAAGAQRAKGAPGDCAYATLHKDSRLHLRERLLALWAKLSRGSRAGGPPKALFRTLRHSLPAAAATVDAPQPVQQGQLGPAKGPAGAGATQARTLAVLPPPQGGAVAMPRSPAASTSSEGSLISLSSSDNFSSGSEPYWAGLHRADHGSSFAPQSLQGQTPADRSVSSPASPIPSAKSRPLTPEFCRAQRLNAGYATLNGDAGRYVLGRARLRGSFGKLHHALALAGDGERLAVKEMRLLPKPGVDRLWQAAKTHPTTPAQIEAEVACQRAFARAVAVHMPATRAALGAKGPALWRQYAGQGEPPTALDLIYDLAHVSKNGQLMPKAFVVQNLAAGDAAGLLDDLDRAPMTRMGLQIRRALVRSFAMQLFSQLHVLHAHAGYAHFDIKPENVQIDGEGSFYLADFGLSLPLSARGTSQSWGKRGSIAAPEMLAGTKQGASAKPRLLCSKADVFALAATTLQALVGMDVASPFEWRYASEAGVVDAQATAETLRAFFVAAYTMQADGQGQLAPTGALLTAEAWSSSGNPTVDNFFQLAFARDPELTRCLLRFALHPRPADRLGALALARASTELLALLPPPTAERVRAVFAVGGNCPAREADYAGLGRFAAAVRAGEAAARANAAA